MTREEKIKKLADKRMKMIKTMKELRPDFDFSAFNAYKRDSYSIIKCDKGHEFKSTYAMFTNKPVCRCCVKGIQGRSHEESEIIDYLEKRGIKTLRNYRCLVGPKTEIVKSTGRMKNLLEIDVFIPSLNIGIEYDDKSHNDNVIKKRYDNFDNIEEYHKYKDYQAELLGIKILHIPENFYHYDKEEALKYIFNECLNRINSKTLIKALIS